MKITYEFLIYVFLFSIVCLLYQKQPLISYNEGKGWDGVAYYNITEQICESKTTIEGNLPFIKRFGTFFFVAKLSQTLHLNLFDSALLINLLGSLFVVLLLAIWLRIFFDSFFIRTILVILYLFMWSAPTRFSFFYPFTSDVWGAVWLLIVLLILEKIRTAIRNEKSVIFLLTLFSVVVAISSFFRESNLILSIFPIFVKFPLFEKSNIDKFDKLRRWIYNLFKKQNILFLMPIIFAFLIHFLISFLLLKDENENGYSYLGAFMRWFYTKNIFEFLLGILNAFGPLILLLPFFIKSINRVCFHRNEIALLTIIALFYGFFGGSDTERIVFMFGFPAIFIMIGIAVQKMYHSPQRWWLFMLFILETIAMRVYWFIPDYPPTKEGMQIPFFTFWGNNFPYLFLFSHHGNIALNCILLFEYIVLFFFTLLIIRSKKIMFHE